jgi:hypothetical protein
MPISGTIAVSLQGTQSQSGVMWSKKFMKPSLPVFSIAAPTAYSTIRSVNAGIPWSSPHLWHLPGRRSCIRNTRCIPPFLCLISLIPVRWHAAGMLPHISRMPHTAPSTFMSLAECCCCFPAGGAHPMARFLIAPPKPATSWPLKCESTTIEGASDISGYQYGFEMIPRDADPAMGLSRQSVRDNQRGTGHREIKTVLDGRIR